MTLTGVHAGLGFPKRIDATVIKMLFEEGYDSNPPERRKIDVEDGRG